MSEATAVAELGERSREVVRQEDPHPLTLIERAMDKGLDVESLERLIALQERMADRQAEQAMAEALAGFQQECPQVPRTETAEVKKDGRLQYTYKYASYDVTVGVVRPFLAKHGLSFTHNSRIDGKEVEVTCTLQHVAGATRTADFRGPFDNSGGKNPLQAVGSSRSYGKRYTLSDVLGIATEDDDDGVGAAGPTYETISDKQEADLQALIEEVGADKAKFLEWMGVESLSDIPAAHLETAVRSLEKKRKKAGKAGGAS